MEKYIALSIVALAYLLYWVFLRRYVNLRLDARYLHNIIKILPDYCQHFKFNEHGLKKFKQHVLEYAHRLTEEEREFVNDLTLDKFAKLGKILRK